MGKYQFTTSEYCFPVWGRLAMEMAKEAGFDGINITDGGECLMPHPKNNGFIEYERFGSDLRRKDSFPLSNPYIRDYYMEAAAETGITLTGIDLYLMGRQGFYQFQDGSPQADQYYETVDVAICAAAAMKIPMVTIPVKGMFSLGEHTYAFRKLEYAVKKGAEQGVKVAATMDGTLARQIEALESIGGLSLDFLTIDPVWSAKGDPADFIRGLPKDRICRFRMKDMKKDGEGFITKETSPVALLGEGDACFARCAEAIRETGYEGWILSDTSYYSSDIVCPGEDYVSPAGKDVCTLKNAFGAE